jgi:hypothetical protein
MNSRKSKMFVTNTIQTNNPQTIAGRGFCRRFEITTNQSTMTNLSISHEEIWLPVSGYEGRYEISNFGNIKALSRPHYKRKSPILVKKQLDRYGYHYVHISNGIKGRNIKVHRLVAIAFIPNPENKSDVNHIDGNKLNNHVSNLEWATIKENVRHAHDTGLRTMDHLIALSRTKKLSKNHRARAIIQYNLDGTIVRKWDCLWEAVLFFGKKTNSSIGNCCRGQQRTAYGFKWSYAD